MGFQVPSNSNHSVILWYAYRLYEEGNKDLNTWIYFILYEIHHMTARDRMQPIASQSHKHVTETKQLLISLRLTGKVSVGKYQKFKLKTGSQKP